MSFVWVSSIIHFLPSSNDFNADIYSNHMQVEREICLFQLKNLFLFSTKSHIYGTQKCAVKNGAQNFKPAKERDTSVYLELFKWKLLKLHDVQLVFLPPEYFIILFLIFLI